MIINLIEKYNFDIKTFDLSFKDKNKNKNIKNIIIKLLGKHNVLNAAAAFIVCLNGANMRLAKKFKKLFWGSKKND